MCLHLWISILALVPYSDYCKYECKFSTFTNPYYANNISVMIIYYLWSGLLIMHPDTGITAKATVVLV